MQMPPKVFVVSKKFKGRPIEIYLPVNVCGFLFKDNWDSYLVDKWFQEHWLLNNQYHFYLEKIAFIRGPDVEKMTSQLWISKLTSFRW